MLPPAFIIAAVEEVTTTRCTLPDFLQASSTLSVPSLAGLMSCSCGSVIRSSSQKGLAVWKHTCEKTELVPPPNKTHTRTHPGILHCFLKAPRYEQITTRNHIQLALDQIGSRFGWKRPVDLRARGKQLREKPADCADCLQT